MKNLKYKIFIGLVIGVFGFLFGWQGATIYNDFSNFGPKADMSTTTPSPTSIFAPILENVAGKGIDLSLFWKVWSTLEGKYVHDELLNDDQMIYGAIKGLVSSLNDPYTIYLTPKETKEFKDSLNGALEGIGAELTVRDYNLVVVSPLKNSPAEEAGLLPNDIVYKIDGEIAGEMTLYEAVMKIRGKVGTEVVLTVIREELDEPFDISIKRRHIDIESVSLEDKEDDIFLLSVNQFSDDTKTEFTEKISEILLNEPKGIILDLRFNGGGYLDIAVDILSEFLSGNKEAVTIKKKNEKDDEKIYVYNNARMSEVPLVILINNGSASASEIVAGAIQDHKRGIVIGEQSFGKGTVQEIETFSDGSSLRMTIAEWFTPSGKSIDKAGVTPDIIIEMNEDDYFKEDFDPQMDKAIEYLSNIEVAN